MDYPHPPHGTETETDAAPAVPLPPPTTLPEPVLQPRRSRKKWLLGLGGLALLALVLLGVWVLLAYNAIRTTVERTPLEIPLVAQEPLGNQIAFVGNDFNVWLVSPGGNNLRRLTQDGQGYRFPTWSPDGRQLAFIGRDETSISVLYVAATGGGKPQIVYRQPNSPPFYLYWSPDSRHITFLTQESTDIAMRIADTAGEDSPRILERGAPFYWVWSPASDRLLMHVGGSRAASADAHLSMMANQLDAAREPLDDAPGRFQAPLWSSTGSHVFYIAENEGGSESIFRAEADTLAAQEVVPLRGFAHMVLAPDDRHIAYLQYEAGTRPPFGRAYLVGADGQESRQLTNSLVASIYWSPDGKKLALLTLNRPSEGPTARAAGLASPLPQEFTLRWWIYNLETEELAPLVSFAPTINFLQTIPYFDQYHLSLTFWSPDSRYLVVTKKLDEGSAAGSVWVVDTTGQEEPRKVGDGSLAVWSWQ
ncbi:MAG: PD40 domain-containing protein [Anaerolineae bacterium]